MAFASGNGRRCTVKYPQTNPMNFKPYSDRLIFFDTEFTHLDPRKGELISIGLVKYSGEELYLELEYTGEPHPWVTEKVLPYLKGPKVGREEAKKRLREFVGPDQPYLVAYVNQFDAVFWYDLFGSPMDHPAFWIPIDFASILFALGYPPDSMGRENFWKELGLVKQTGVQHNALDDARWLWEVYLALQAKAGL